MANTRKKIEVFPKTDWSEEQVDAVRLAHLAHGAVSCVKSATAADYRLTTEWPIID